MTAKELWRTCQSLILEITGLMTEADWDATLTLIDTMSPGDARAEYERAREKVLGLLEIEAESDRRSYVDSLPVGSRGLVLFFARIAVGQAGEHARVVGDAQDAVENLESPIRILCEGSERPESLNNSYLGLF